MIVKEKNVVKFMDAWKTSKYGKAYADKTDMLPVEILKKFKEYDRKIRPLRTSEEVDETRKELLEKGIEEQLILMYNPSTGYASIGEGNHRLMIAIENGVTHLPVRVSRNYYLEPDKSKKRGGAYIKNPKIPLFRCKAHVNADLKPSEVFDINDFYEENQLKRHIVITHYNLIKKNQYENARRLLRFYCLKEKVYSDINKPKDDFIQLIEDIYWLYLFEIKMDYNAGKSTYYVK